MKATDDSSQVYDNSFKTMTVRIPRFNIPLLNEMFGTDYDMGDVVELEYNEDTGIYTGFRIKRRSSDSKLSVDGKRYHLECESTVNSEIAIRLFEYDWIDAVNQVSNVNGVYVVRLQNSGLLFLRSSKNTPEKYTYKLVLPGGQEVEYQVPIVKNLDYSLMDIFEKKLYMLLPFYVLQHEKKYQAICRRRDKLLKCELTERVETELWTCDYEEKQLAEILARDLDYIYNELNIRVQEGELEDYERSMLCQLIRNVGAQVFRKVPVLQERMVNGMGGQVLEFDWDIEYRKMMSEARAEGLQAGRAEGLQAGMAEGLEKGMLEGREKGMAEGRLEGRLEGENRKLVSLICRKLSKGKSVEVIAEELEEEIEVVRNICEIAKEYAPDYDVEQIHERMQMVAV